jgi:hypothetical protein
MAKAKNVDVSDFLSSNAGAKSKGGKKNGIPELTEHGELADRVANASKAMKDSKAAFAAVEAQLLDITAVEYEQRATSGEFTKTLNVQGVATSGVQVTYKDMFSAIDIEEKAELEERLGDRFALFFEEKRVLTLTDTSDAAIQLLLEKLGPETFKQLFEIKVSIGAKGDLDRKQYDIPEDIRPTQAKASVKVRK